MAVTVIAGQANAGFFDKAGDALDPTKNGTSDAFEQLNEDTGDFWENAPQIPDSEDW